MVANEIGFDRFIRSKFLPHKPVHLVVEVLGADTSMPMIQAGFHRAVTIVHGVEMPGSVKPFALTAIDHFMGSLEVPRRRSIAGIRITDDHCIGRRPGLQRDRDW